MSVFKNLLNRKRVITCQRCQQQLRVPLHSSSTLRITCPKCRAQFTIAFINPLSTLLKWDKSQSIKHNIHQRLNTFKQLPIGTRLILIAFIFIALIQSKLTSDFIDEKKKTYIDHTKKYVFIAHEGDETSNKIKNKLKKIKIKTFSNKSNDELINIYIKNRNKYDGVILSYISAYPVIKKYSEYGLIANTEEFGIILEYFPINNKKKELSSDINEIISEIQDSGYINKICKSYYNLDGDDISCDLI